MLDETLVELDDAKAELDETRGKLNETQVQLHDTRALGCYTVWKGTTRWYMVLHGVTG